MENTDIKTLDQMVGTISDEFPEYFHPEEFYRCVPSCSVDDMRSFFMYKLNVARHIAGVPFHLNSAYRSVDWEKKHGRTGSSSHCKGLAVDVRCFSDHDRYRIVYGAICAGFRRIGVHRSFVHLDLDPDKHPAVWLY